MTSASLYEADVIVTRMLSNICIVEMAVDNAAEHAADKEPPELPTMTKIRNMLRASQQGRSSGEQQLMRCNDQILTGNRPASCSSFFHKNKKKFSQGIMLPLLESSPVPWSYCYQH